MADQQHYGPRDSYPPKVGSQRSSGNRREDNEAGRTISGVSDGGKCDKYSGGKVDQRFGQKDDNSSSYGPSSSQNTSSYGSNQNNQNNQINQINQNTIECSSIYRPSSSNDNQDKPHNSNNKNKHQRTNESTDEPRTKESSKSSGTQGKFDASIYGAPDSDTRDNDDNGSKKYTRKQPQFVKSVGADGKGVFKRKQKVPVMQKSLAIVLASLLGVQVVIELKNDTQVTGVIDEADRNMNLTLHDVRQVSSAGVITEMELFFLSGFTIRYVHIPKEYPIVKHLTMYMKTIERVSLRGPNRVVDRKRKADDDIPDF